MRLFRMGFGLLSWREKLLLKSYARWKEFAKIQPLYQHLLYRPVGDSLIFSRGASGQFRADFTPW